PERRREPAREREHLRCRAVVLLEPDDRGALREREQVLGAGAGEAVDRLVVVADRAEIFPLAEPELEQRLLEEVHVLVLVDGERAVAGAELRSRSGVVLEEPDRELEQILEVGPALLTLPLLIAAVDLRHQVWRDRRHSLADLDQVPIGRDPPVAGPFDLRREVAGRTEAVRARQEAREIPERDDLRREDAADPVRCEVAQLGERRRVERPRLDRSRAERGEPRPQLARGLVGEGDSEDLLAPERVARDLVRDPARDRRRLAG